MAQTADDTAAIGKAVSIKGEVFSNQDLYVDGTLEGKIEVPASKLTVGPHGTVKTAVIKAGSLDIQGTVEADVNVRDRVEIRRNASLTGNVKTARIVIEEGAFFKGGVDITRPPDNSR